ncbi:rhomboid family intramembrane serine protease [Marinicellulosiphila megalodicopiae]|uniref:rhomboid family intramembrane serine protease n=1 Tax=Marinicellulosiphila megalodicopiae TaxID=2724896 RepID=UPI003BAFD605
MAIYPREFSGLIGILCAPFLHGSWGHLAANTFPLLVLGSLHTYGYPKTKWKTLLIILLVSGVGVWLFGRPNYHLGASSITSGLFYFLLIAGLFRRDRVSICLMLIAVFMFGSILLGIFPLDPKISFEAHFFGALGGSICAFLFEKQDSKPPVKVYEWEKEGYSIEDEGEYWKIGYVEPGEPLPPIDHQRDQFPPITKK